MKRQHTKEASKKRILVVDDVDAIHIAFGLALVRNYDVVCARTGKEAREIFLQACPDLVMLDIGLSDISGLEILRYMRATNPNTPVIVCTGSQCPKMIATAEKLGVDGFLFKPFELDQARRLAACATSLRSRVA